MSQVSRRVLRRLALVFALGASALAPAAASAGSVTPVPKLDPEQYIGQWRQIASIPQWFEVLCYSDTVANYSLNDDGTVRVVNRCFSLGGLEITTRGRARILDPVTSAQLQVTFLNIGGNWIYPNNEPNYIVMGLSPEYRWAVVGDPDRSSAFVLSRTSTLSADDKAKVLGVLSANGYNACSLNTTRQRGGLQSVRQFCR
jgi:apolipoprotein D and lipocalin family protein